MSLPLRLFRSYIWEALRRLGSRPCHHRQGGLELLTAVLCVTCYITCCMRDRMAGSWLTWRLSQEQPNISASLKKSCCRNRLIKSNHTTYLQSTINVQIDPLALQQASQHNKCSSLRAILRSQDEWQNVPHHPDMAGSAAWALQGAHLTLGLGRRLKSNADSGLAAVLPSAKSQSR